MTQKSDNPCMSKFWLGRQDSNLFPDYGAALKDKSGQSPARRVARIPTRRRSLLKF